MLENLVNEFNSKSLFLSRSSFFPQIFFLKLIETFFKERVIFLLGLGTPNYSENYLLCQIGINFLDDSWL